MSAFSEGQPQVYRPNEPLFLSALANLNVAELTYRFNENGYVKIERFLTEPLLSVAYSYMLLKLRTGEESHDRARIAGTMLLYGDCLMESILELSTLAIERITQKNLWPTFAYCRLYENRDVLRRHRDRPGCEISVSVSLGHDVRDVRKVSPDYAWPIYMNGNAVACEPGDMVIYKGCDVLHWREAFEGESQALLFLHYIDRERKDADFYKWDGRPSLGLPAEASASANVNHGVLPTQLTALQELGFSSSKLSLELLNLKADRSGTNNQS